MDRHRTIPPRFNDPSDVPPPEAGADATGETLTPDYGEWLGRTVAGRFRLETFVGTGTFGAVFRGSDERFPGRDIAVKIGLGVREHDHFFREAKLLGQVNSDHVVSVYEYGQDDGVPYIVMEFLNGKTLAELLSEADGQPLPQELISKCVEEVGRALTSLHTVNLFHRDLKPENIMLVDIPDASSHSGDQRDTQRFKIIDFGISAKIDADDSRRNMTFDGAGTPEYMAPEQLQSEPVTPRSEVYSLGVLLFVLHSGRVPFQASGTSVSALADLVKLVLQEPAPRLSEAAGPDVRIPHALDQLVTACLAKQPEERPATVADLCAWYRKAMRAESGAKTANTASGRTRSSNIEPKSETRSVRPIVILLILIIVAGGAALAWIGPEQVGQYVQQARTWIRDATAETPTDDVVAESDPPADPPETTEQDPEPTSDTTEPDQNSTPENSTEPPETTDVLPESTDIAMAEPEQPDVTDSVPNDVTPPPATDPDPADAAPEDPPENTTPSDPPPLDSSVRAIEWPGLFTSTGSLVTTAGRSTPRSLRMKELGISFVLVTPEEQQPSRLAQFDPPEKPFYISERPISRGLYAAVTSPDSGNSATTDEDIELNGIDVDDLIEIIENSPINGESAEPVSKLRWLDCDAFCLLLTQEVNTGRANRVSEPLKFRLPKNSEWWAAIGYFSKDRGDADVVPNPTIMGIYDPASLGFEWTSTTASGTILEPRSLADHNLIDPRTMMIAAGRNRKELAYSMVNTGRQKPAGQSGSPVITFRIVLELPGL